MNREEAIIDLKAKITRIKSILDDGLCANLDYWAIKLKWHEDMLSALHSPQPDPITGLMPCGCGEKARIKHDGSYSSKCIVKNADETVQYEGATVLYPGHTHAWVDCDNNKCECSVGYSGGLIFKTDEEARDAWNRAMGYKGGAE